MKYQSTKLITLGSCCFRQPKAESHCKFLHGYNLTAKFWFKSDYLDKNNWVVDFGSFKEVKKKLEKVFDHKTIISKNDPQLETFKKLDLLGVIDLVIMDGVGIEKFAEYCFNLMNENIPERVFCIKAEVWEHGGNSAIFKS